MSDIELALTRLRALTGDADVKGGLSLVHPGQPIPKERPRFSRKIGRFYTPARTSGAEEALAWAFKRARGSRSGYTDTVAIVALFFVPTRHRLDVDNCMKLVMDAATKAGAWKDDSQVNAQACYIDLDADHPRTVVAICPYLSSLSRTPLFTASSSERTL